MTPRTPAAASRHSLVESISVQFHSWRPFLPSAGAKRPCLSDRATSQRIIPDLSKLCLFDLDPLGTARKRRRRRPAGSRSISGRSSDRRATAGGGTDSSGEMLLNGDVSWGSDASDARVARMEVVVDREGQGLGSGVGGSCGSGGHGAGGATVGGIVVEILQGNESGYGSEQGYRGDVELGYDDELDEEDDDGKQLFWGLQKNKDGSEMEMMDNSEFGEQKSHHRCRRRKHDWKLITTLR